MATASNLGLLNSRIKSEQSTTERSHSKRLYTFFHYEHSIYPRLWVILFFVVIIASLSIGWLISGLARLRDTASFGESCAASKVRCRSGTGLSCSLASSLCLCLEGTYWSSSLSKCLAVKTKDEPCTNYEQCDQQNGLVCHSNQTCQCPDNTYFSASSCISYLSYQASCNVSSSPTCNIQLGLICDSVSFICICPSSTYWSGARCEIAASYDEYCSHNISCNHQAGLFCRLSSSDPPCDCPSPSKFYTCDCSPGYAWFDASINNSTAGCGQLTSHFSNCTSDEQCSQSLNLVCIAGVCDCSVPFWFWSVTSQQCVPCEANGDKLIQYQSQWICTRMINDTLTSYANSKSACAAFSWSLISPIVAADISVIAQSYPTYRIWVYMETTLGSSNYTNIVFPSNQSNWNAFVSTGTSSSYATQVYALQIIPSYSSTFLFEGNTNVDMGHTLCMLY